MTILAGGTAETLTHITQATAVVEGAHGARLRGDGAIGAEEPTRADVGIGGLHWCGCLGVLHAVITTIAQSPRRGEARCIAIEARSAWCALRRVLQLGRVAVSAHGARVLGGATRAGQTVVSDRARKE